MTAASSNRMDAIVALCKRRGFIFQNSEIYGGQNGFWDYGPLGAELKRNVREAWWREMVTLHDGFTVPDGAPTAFDMVGLDSSIIMHPQVWRVSGHYDLFADEMIDCRACKSRFRSDHLADSQCPQKPSKCPGEHDACELTEPRPFNLMFETNVGALIDEDNKAFLRPETAQGIFVNFKNVMDSSRVKIPVGICQIGKSFRNEITPRNYTFRSREFEQMECEFFCRPDSSQDWYGYWRDRRFGWYKRLGISDANLQLREHHADELAHYSVGTADIEYAFPFLADGEYGELEGVAHRGDFDLRSHSEGKLKAENGELVLDADERGQPKYRGSGKDLSYFDEATRERFVPHVIEPSAGADRATLAFLCEAYREDEQPDEKGKMQSRTLLSLHPRLAPIKAAVFPLIKKEGMPEKAQQLCRTLKAHGLNATYDQQGAIGRRYRRQDEIGTPYCLTVDGDTMADDTVTLRDRDTLEQTRVKVDEVAAVIAQKIAEA